MLVLMVDDFMLALTVDDCSAAMHACFGLGDCSAGMHAYFES